MAGDLKCESSSTTESTLLRSMGISAALALALLTGYVGMYSVALDGKVYYAAGVDPTTGINRYRIESNFRFFDTTSAILFKPALRADRWVRNEYWNTVEKADGTKWRNL